MALPTEKDLEQCICSKRCPSYVKGDTGLFCFYGKSEKDIKERGCLCRTCPVFVKYQLNNRAFCLRGKATE